jgi:hypothetical protein
LTYRDDRDAAHARADALERTLDEERRKREELEAALAERDRDLSSVREELAREQASPEAVARRKLDAVKARGAARAVAPTSAPPPSSSPDGAGWERRLRVARSADWLVALHPVAVFSATLFGLAIMSIVTLNLLPAVDGTAEWVGLALVVLVVAASYLTARGRITAWAASRPYVLTGLIAALEKPPTRVTDIVLTLRFVTAAPPDLVAILTSFDPELTVSAGTARRRIERTPWGRGGVDHQHHKVYAWLRRCDREVLVPLHRAHGLVEVGIRLQ